MPRLLDANAVQAALRKLPSWKREGNAIERTVRFADFLQAIAFVNRLAELAEAIQHHPDLDIRYNQVRIILSTHSQGGLTELDFDLAERIGRMIDE